MARFGIWKPLATNWASQSKLTTPDIICLHTIVGTVAGTDGMWRKTGYSGTFSHLGIAGDGTATQWQDTAYRGAANYNGNHRIISVECADLDSSFAKWNTADGKAVPAFTAAQVETLAQLIAAMCKAHNIPCVLIPDAKPGRRGIGYHRQGVPGYMVAGAEQWSTATGKVCPGDRRIAQIPQIIARAQQILSGQSAATPLEDDVTTDAQIAEIVHRVLDTDVGGGTLSDLVRANIAIKNNDGTPKSVAGQTLDVWLDGDGNTLAGFVREQSKAKPASAAPAQAVSVDAGSVAAALAGHSGFITAVAEATAVAMDRRGRDGDPTTGPVS